MVDAAETSRQHIYVGHENFVIYLSGRQGAAPSGSIGGSIRSRPLTASGDTGVETIVNGATYPVSYTHLTLPTKA